jgi:hypothetical protein
MALGESIVALARAPDLSRYVTIVQQSGSASEIGPTAQDGPTELTFA